MQPISDVLSRVGQKRHLGTNPRDLARKAINHPKVQEFLKENQDKVDKNMIANSVTNLFTFVQQLEHPDNKVMAGYQPKLFINGNVIDITYTATPEKIEKDKIIRAKRRVELIDLPHKLRDVELENLDKTPERKEVLVDIASFLKQYSKDPHAKGLYLEGKFGVGKTYLLAGLANAAARLGANVVFLHVPTFIASLGSHIQDNSINEEINRIANSSIVIFDDIGAETLSPWSRDDVLGVILQKRMDNELPTFFSSNLDMKSLEEHFAETRNTVDEVKAKRLMARVKFLSKEVVVLGKDRRN